VSRHGVLCPSTLLSSQLLGGIAVPSNWSEPPTVGYDLGDPGRPSEVPTLLITDFDNSGSVICHGGTDPLSNRFAEATRAFSVVARKGSRHELGAVVHFDTPTSGDVGPVPLTRLGLLTLRRGLRVPPDGAGSSELTPSLRRAVEIAETRPGYAATLVVLSDFQLLDREPSQVLSDLAAFPGDVHAVVLGGYLPAGVLDDRIIVTRVQREDPPGAVARAVFASLMTHRQASPSTNDAAGKQPSWIPQRFSRRKNTAR
jgi:hypothetical protein